MARGKKHTAEQIVDLLRQVEVGVANGETLPQACKEAEIGEQTYYRWRREFGGLKVDQARRPKELELENAKVKRLVADLSLEKLVLKGYRGGKLLSPEWRRCAVSHAHEAHGLSERHACRVVKQPRGTFKCSEARGHRHTRSRCEISSSH